MLELHGQIEEAVGVIRSRWESQPHAGIILGTGLGSLVEQIEVQASFDYGEIPHFPQSTAISHAGRLLCGTLEGLPVVAMEGRMHMYEGYPLKQITLPVRVMKALGADLAYMGTRFINTEESEAEDAYRNMIIEAVSADIIHTPAVSGVPASFMRQSLEAAGFDMQKLNQAGDVNYGEKLKPMDDEAKAWKTVWSAGQGVSQIHDVVPVEALVQRLEDEYQQARSRLMG